MWLMHNNYGNITREMVKEWRTAHYVYDAQGMKHTTLLVDGKEISPNLIPRLGTLCAHSSGPAGVDTLKEREYVRESVHA
ncbi:MAG TPA: hypothetical protein VK604_03325 [Bryobacteraceae bacterium]|nr:hypothetical protein [Bryobacteraceae bacterium]